MVSCLYILSQLTPNKVTNPSSHNWVINKYFRYSIQNGALAGLLAVPCIETYKILWKRERNWWNCVKSGKSKMARLNVRSHIGWEQYDQVTYITIIQERSFSLCSSSSLRCLRLLQCRKETNAWYNGVKLGQHFPHARKHCTTKVQVHWALPFFLYFPLPTHTKLCPQNIEGTSLLFKGSFSCCCVVFFSLFLFGFGFLIEKQGLFPKILYSRVPGWLSH